ncbi:unnamed protein product [Bathycoccus prasinos]
MASENLSVCTRYQTLLLNLKSLQSYEYLLLRSRKREEETLNDDGEEINNFATALESTFPILNKYALCLQRPMEVSGKNARERNEVMESRVAVIPSTGVSVPLGDIDVENAILISDQFNVSEFHAIEALAGSAGRIAPARGGGGGGQRGVFGDEEDDDAQTTRLFAAGNIFQERASCLESLSVLLRERQTVRALERDSNYRGANEASRNAFREFSGFVDEVVLMGKRFDGGSDGNAASGSLDEQSLANRLAKLIRAAPTGGPLGGQPAQRTGQPPAIGGGLFGGFGSQQQNQQVQIMQADKFEIMYDSRNRANLRSDVLAKEKTQVAELLFLAASLSPPLSQGDAVEVFLLAGWAAEQMRFPSQTPPDYLPTCYSTLFASVTALMSPLEDVRNVLDQVHDPKRKKLEAFLKSIETTVKSPNPPAPFAIVRLAWSCVAMRLGFESGEEVAKSAIRDGAFDAMTAILQTGAFQDDREDNRRNYLHLVANAVLGEFTSLALDRPTLSISLTDGTCTPTFMELEAANRISNGDLGDTEFEEPCPTSALASLMIALAETCSQDPSLVGDEESAAAFNAATTSPDYDPEQDDYEMSKQSPALRLVDACIDLEHSVVSLMALLDLCAAVSKHDIGSKIAFKVLARGAGGCNWDELLKGITGYIARYDLSRGLEENTADGSMRSLVSEEIEGLGENQQYDPRMGEPEMNDADVKALEKYLKALAACFSTQAREYEESRGETGAKASSSGREQHKQKDSNDNNDGNNTIGTSSRGGSFDQIGAAALEAARGEDPRRRWIRYLEERMDMDLCEALLNLYVDPVPPKMKAALLNCIQSLCEGCVQKTNDAWGFLEMKGALHVPTPVDARVDLKDVSSALTIVPTLPGSNMDVAYHYYQTERNQSQYEGTLAYARFFNFALETTKDAGYLDGALDMDSAGACSFNGRSAWHHARFLRFDVFGQLQSRRHLEDSERWMLAGECLRAFQSCLELYDVADEEEKIIPIKTSSNRGQFNDHDRQPLEIGFNVSLPLAAAGEMRDRLELIARDSVPPGRDLILDFLHDGITFRGILDVISVGAERLSRERSQLYGESLENAVLRSLNVLSTALTMDLEHLERLHDAKRDVGFKALDVYLVFREDGQRFADIVSYCQYPYNPSLALAALEIATEISRRVDGLPRMLRPEVRAGLIEGCSTLLEQSFSLQPPATNDVYESGDTYRSDRELFAEACGECVLNLIDESIASHPSPNMAELLLGFDITGACRTTPLRPDLEFTCSTVLIECLESSPPSMAASFVVPLRAPEIGMKILFECSRRFETAPSTLDFLRSWNAFPVLVDDACRAAMAINDTNQIASRKVLEKRISVAAHKAWIFELATNMLIADSPSRKNQRSEGEVPTWVVDIVDAMLALRRRDQYEQDAIDGRVPALDAALTLGESIDNVLVSRTISRISSEVKQTIDELDCEKYLKPGGGCERSSSRGDIVTDVGKLKRKLLAEAVARDDDGSNRQGRSSRTTNSPGDGLSGVSLALIDESDAYAQSVPRLVSRNRERAILAAAEIAIAKNLEIEDSNARRRAFEAWETCVSTAICRALPSAEFVQAMNDTYDQLINIEGGSGEDQMTALRSRPRTDRAFLAYEVLDGCMRLLNDSNRGGGSDSPKSIACCALAAKIMKKLTYFAKEKLEDAAPLSVSACRTTLRGIFGSLTHRFRVNAASRMRLIDCLREYLEYCRRIREDPRSSSFLESKKARKSSEFQNGSMGYPDSVLLDGDVEKANADIIRREAGLILEQLSRDVSHGSEEARAAAADALEAILTAVCVTTTTTSSSSSEPSSSNFGFASSTNVSTSSSTNLEREYVRLGIFSRACDIIASSKMSELALETSYAESRFKTTLSSIKLLLTASIACPNAIAFSEPNNNILGAFDALIHCDTLDAYADVNGAACAESSAKAGTPIAPLPLSRRRHHEIFVNVLRVIHSLLKSAQVEDDEDVKNAKYDILAGENIDGKNQTYEQKQRKREEFFKHVQQRREAVYAAVVQKTEQFIDRHRDVIARALADRALVPHVADLSELEASLCVVSSLLKISPNDSPKLRETLDHVTVRFCGPESPMDKYWKYCRDAETRELTGKGNRIYDDDDKDDEYNNNINEQDYYGVREARRQEKIAMHAKQTRIIRESAENLLRGSRIVRSATCKAQRDLLVRNKRPSLQVSSITSSSMNAGAAPTLSMFASLASDVGRELLVELRARDEIIREAKRADGIYEEEEEEENNTEEGDGEDALYDENENINGALLEKNSFVPSDAETRSVLATKDGAIAILLETFEASLEIVLLHAKASRLEDTSASSAFAREKKDANFLSTSRRHHNVLNNVLVRESHEYVRTSAFSRHDIEQLSHLSSAALSSIDKATKRRRKYIFSSNARSFLRAKRLAENVKVVLSVTSEMRSILQQQQQQPIRVKWFNASKGFGFIIPDDGSEEIFVHQSHLKAEGFRSLGESEKVEYDVDATEGEKTKAINVTGPDGSNVLGSKRLYRKHKGGGSGGPDGEEAPGEPEAH